MRRWLTDASVFIAKYSAELYSEDKHRNFSETSADQHEKMWYNQTKRMNAYISTNHHENINTSVTSN
jgi:hypothetical protein